MCADLLCLEAPRCDPLLFSHHVTDGGLVNLHRMNIGVKEEDHCEFTTPGVLFAPYCAYNRSCGLFVEEEEDCSPLDESCGVSSYGGFV